MLLCSREAYDLEDDVEIRADGARDMLDMIDVMDATLCERAVATTTVVVVVAAAAAVVVAVDVAVDDDGNERELALVTSFILHG